MNENSSNPPQGGNMLERVWEIQEVLQSATVGDYSRRVDTSIRGAMFDDPLVAISPSINLLLDELNARDKRVEEQRAELLAQSEAIRDLSTPVVQIWDNVLALPLVGVLDSSRASQVMEVALKSVIDLKARFIIVDITGIALVDSLVASYLAQTVAAVKLIGAESILTGISSNVAQTLVKLGIDISSLVTRATLADGLKYALRKMGYEIKAPK